MAVIDGIGLAEPSTITKNLAAVPITRNSSVTYQEVMVLGSPNSTTLLSLAEVIGSAPASTTVGLVVRVAEPSTGPVAISSVSGVVAISPVSTASVRVAQSTAGDLLVEPRLSTANANSSAYLPVRLTDGSSFIVPAVDYTDGSTVSTLVGPALSYNNSSNNTMRLVSVAQPLPVQLRTGTLTLNSTTTVITSTHSTAVYALVSSAALRQKVYAFHLTSTHTNPSTLVFMSSLGSDLWHVGFGSGSSGVTGANLAVTPPAYLFATAANEALNVRIEGGNSTVTSTTVARVSFSYISEA